MTTEMPTWKRGHGLDKMVIAQRTQNFNQKIFIQPKIDSRPLHWMTTEMPTWASGPDIDQIETLIAHKDF